MPSSVSKWLAYVDSNFGKKMTGQKDKRHLLATGFFAD
jgi:hypothetical protein